MASELARGSGCSVRLELRLQGRIVVFLCLLLHFSQEIRVDERDRNCPAKSLARTSKDDGMIVMSVNPALVRSSYNFWLRCDEAPRVLGGIHRRQRRAGNTKPRDKKKHDSGGRLHRFISKTTTQLAVNELGEASFHSTR